MLVESGGNTGNVGVVLLDSFRGQGQLPSPMAESLKNLIQYLKIEYPSITNDIMTHGERNAVGSNPGLSQNEATAAIPIIEGER